MGLAPEKVTVTLEVPGSIDAAEGQGHAIAGNLGARTEGVRAFEDPCSGRVKIAVDTTRRDLPEVSAHLTGKFPGRDQDVAARNPTISAWDRASVISTGEEGCAAPDYSGGFQEVD
jgi:hypothetical protein